MRKQIKRVLSLSLAIAIIAGVAVLPAAAMTQEEMTISDVAEQNSVIEEQATMLLKTTIPAEEEMVEIEIEEETQEEEEIIVSPYYELIDNLTEEERNYIYQITFLESGNQEIEGQRAVIEVILNRVLSDKYPNTVEEVLSQSGQFTTWRNRKYASYNEMQEQALELVMIEEPVLTTDYLMFSRGKFSYGKNYVKIQDHWFGTF